LVDLELQIDDELVAGAEVAVVHREPTVSARFADGAGLDGVDLHLLGPASVEDEGQLVDVLLRLDRDPALVVEAAAQVFGGEDLEIGGGCRGVARRRPLAEDVQQAGDERQQDQGEKGPPEDELDPFGSVPIPSQREELRRHGHAA
jgi:hypothetical protein